MPTRRRHPRLGAVTFNLITHSRSLSRLGIDHLHIRNLDPGFLVDNSTAAIAGSFLVSFDYACAFDFHFATSWSDAQHASTLALVPAGDDYDLIDLPNLGSFSSLPLFHLYCTNFIPCATPIDLWRQRNYHHHLLLVHVPL